MTILVGVAYVEDEVVTSGAVEVEFAAQGGGGGEVEANDFHFAHIGHGPKVHVLDGNGNDFVVDMVDVEV